MDKKNNYDAWTSLFDAINECFPLFTEEEIGILEDYIGRLALISLRKALESLEKDGLIKL